MAFPPSAPAPQAPAAPDPAGAEAPTSVVVTDNGDGTFTLSKQDDEAPGQPEQPGEPPDEGSQPVTVNSIEEACKALQQMLGGAQDPKAAWQAEAAGRGPDGRAPVPGAAQAPQMSL